MVEHPPAKNGSAKPGPHRQDSTHPHGPEDSNRAWIGFSNLCLHSLNLKLSSGGLKLSFKLEDAGRFGLIFSCPFCPVEWFTNLSRS